MSSRMILPPGDLDVRDTKHREKSRVSIEDLRMLAGAFCLFGEFCPHVGSAYGCESCIRFVLNLKRIRFVRSSGRQI